MTVIRRTVTVAGLSLAVLVGTGIAASATLSDSTSVQQSIATGTVEAPTQVEVKIVSCHPVRGTAVVEWWASGSPGVTGYRVSRHLADGSSSVVATVDATTSEVVVEADSKTLNSSPTYSVTTLTGYGWTADSARSGVLTC